MTVSLNGEETISRTIESVMNQTYENIEYIVIDGASGDGTIKTAEKYLSRFNAMPNRNMKIVSEPDRGMYDALNKGAQMAHGKIVGQINADDWYEPDAVQTMAELYEREKYNVAWGTVRIKTGKGYIIKRAKNTGGGLHLWTTTHWHHSTMFSERSILLEYPYILENICDDFDFLTRCYVTGKKFSVTDKLISNFQFGGMSTRKSLKEAMKRLGFMYRIYRRYGFSRLYWFQRFVYEMMKYLMA